MREFIFLPLAWAFLLSPLQANDTPRRVIVCSTTQTADFARQVVGDRWQVKSVLAAGQDPHLYQVTAKDSELITTADLCIENGWHLEGKDWMRTLAEDERKPLVTCTTGINPEQFTEAGKLVRDPHAWFSPQNASIYVRNIQQAVSRIDPDHQLEYEARTRLYLDQLRTLHLWIQRQFNSIPANRRVLVTSHDAFNYFCKAYKFQAAAPVGWSTGAETGAGLTPERRQETIDSIRGFGVKTIFIETSVNPRLIREIAREAGVEIGGQLYSDSMGNAGTSGETYLGMMRENVLTIVDTLK
ncbi:MAG: ABC transporter substrate-binding protein [Planctomycetaceae bacterium]|nr:ABC transporter substrate-binding protein [Planctomycetaceae bacterium]